MVTGVCLGLLDPRGAVLCLWRRVFREGEAGSSTRLSSSAAESGLGSPSPVAGCCLRNVVVVGFLKLTYLPDVWVSPRELVISS